MSTQSVTVLTPNGRRQNVKVAPSTTILQILEEACKKHEFAVNEYDLKHHKRILDLTLMFRYAGLPNNCLLEMTEVKKKRENTNVFLCLQLEDGSRVEGSFDPVANLVSIIEKLSPADLAEGKQPVVIYMHKEVFGDNLSATTLKSLGITSGRAMLRIVHKDPEYLKSQANVYIPLSKPSTKTSGDALNKDGSVKRPKINTETIKYIKEEKINEDKSNESDLENPPIINETKDFWGCGEKLQNSEKVCDEEIKLEQHLQDDESIDIIEDKDVHIIELGERNAIIFSLEDTKKMDDDISDSFFDLTVKDVQFLLRDLKKQLSELHDAPLMTSQLRELEEKSKMLTKLGQYKKCVIRIQFPNRLVLQGAFSPVETLETVYDFVKKFLENPNADFYLFTIPPKNILERNKTLLELDCVPTAVLHYSLTKEVAEEENFINEEFLSKLTSPRDALIAAAKVRGLKFKSSGRQDCEGSGNKLGTSKGAIPKQIKSNDFKASLAASQPSGRVPKWFKPTGK